MDIKFRPRRWEVRLNEKFRASHSGKVIVIAGGPSVNDIALEQVAGESLDVIAVNGVMVDERFDALGCQVVAGLALDERFLLRFHGRLFRENRQYPIFTGNTLYDNDGMLGFLESLNIWRIPSNYCEGLGDDFTRFGNGGNSGFAAIQLAVILGYTHVGLIGVDGVKPGQAALRFHSLYSPAGHEATETVARMMNGWCANLDSLRRVFDALGVSVWNLSERSVLREYGCFSLSAFLAAKPVTDVSLVRTSPARINVTVGEMGYYGLPNGCYGGASNSAVAGWYKATPGALELQQRGEPTNSGMQPAFSGEARRSGEARPPVENEELVRLLEDVAHRVGGELLVVPRGEAPLEESGRSLTLSKAGSARVAAVLSANAEVPLEALQRDIAKLRAQFTHCVLVALGCETMPAWLRRLVGHEDTGLTLLESGVVAGSWYSLCEIETAGEAIRVFVGAEPGMTAACRVLQWSTELRSRRSVAWTWMSSEEGENWRGWNTGPVGREGWGTGFSCFRWAIPELCGFEGKAVYLDCDILLVGDIAELWNMDCGPGILSLNGTETSVMLMDCAAYKKIAAWPTIAEMKASSRRSRDYAKLVETAGLFGPLNGAWNCLDGHGYDRDETKLIHFTNRTTQPWRPHPERFVYSAHPNVEIERLWWAHAKAAFASQGGDG